jgi:hypothetical protein
VARRKKFRAWGLALLAAAVVSALNDRWLACVGFGIALVLYLLAGAPHKVPGGDPRRQAMCWSASPDFWCVGRDPAQARVLRWIVVECRHVPLR